MAVAVATVSSTAVFAPANAVGPSVTDAANVGNAYTATVNFVECFLLL